jgi:hypothetical protein
MRILLAGLLLSLASVASGSPITIYSNGMPITDPNTDCSSVCPDLATGVGEGVFTMPFGATLTNVEFWTLQAPDSYKNGALTWQICLEKSCLPGSILSSGNFFLSEATVGFVNVAGFGTNEFDNTFPVGNLSLGPQTYYLDIFDSSGKDTFGVFWATSNPDTLAFELTGTPDSVPEPTTFVLLGAGLAGLLALRRLQTN